VNKNGFTLIELVVVIVILGILAATAMPKFINISSETKITVLGQIKTSVKVANDLLFLKSQMPSYASQPVPGRSDLIDIDMDQDGDFDVFGSDNIDVRLKWRYLDNTDIIKRIDISSDFSVQLEGIDFTYLGYDTDNDGLVKDDNCYFKYTQAQSATVAADYEIISNSC